MAGHRRQTGAVLVAALVLLSAALASGGVVLAQQTDGDAADEAYVESDGDVVLVYEEDGGDLDTGEFGIDVEQGLAYMLLEGGDVGAGDVSGNITASATESELTADGQLSMPKPDQLESLSLDLETVVNDQQSTFDAVFTSTISDMGRMSALLQSASTQGSISMSTDRLQAQGQFAVNSRLAAQGSDASFSFSVREQDGTYTIEADQKQQVSGFAADSWRTREAAKQRLVAQFGAIARGLGGDAAVTIDRYSFSETQEGGQVDIAYTVTIRNVESQLETLLVSQLTSSGELNRSQAQRLASDLTAVSVNELSLTYESGQQSVTGSFTIDVENYGDLAMTYFALADDLGADQTTLQSVERIRKNFEAQRAADVTNELTWQGNVSVGQTATVNAEIHQEVTNWQAYLSEAESRGLPTYDTSFSLGATTEGDRIEMDGSASYAGDRVVTRGVNQLLNASDMDPEAVETLRAFRNADLQKAKFAASFGETLTMEMGATFGDMSALVDHLADTTAMPAFDGVVGRLENDTTRTYVRQSGAVSGSASESDVRELDGVGPDTTIHMPGDWDREFPSMDTERASNFVGAASGGDDGSGGGGSFGSGPGFGVVAAVVGLLAAALWAVRRED